MSSGPKTRGSYGPTSPRGQAATAAAQKQAAAIQAVKDQDMAKKMREAYENFQKSPEADTIGMKKGGKTQSGRMQRKAGGRAKKAGRQHDWNQMEILAIGSRIRFAVNGQEVLDWTDPKPELCESGPLGLQLHSNKVPQEVRFRGLVLVENPQDVLVTAAPTTTEVK